MLKIQNKLLKEVTYDIKDEAKLASIFGIGNGYFGLRGSLEEFGDVFVQGLYIRGVFDSIVEIPLTFADNIYMKNYYFDCQKLKEFEHEDSCINICDPLLVRFKINGKTFLPWLGEVKKWTRYIDMKTGGLVRTLTWDDGEGHLTKFYFERYCSFANNHLILQKVKVEKLNHDLDVEVLLGVDTLVKTNGQHKSKVTFANNHQDGVELNFYLGDKYKMEVGLTSTYETDDLNYVGLHEEDGIYGSKYILKEKTATFTKISSLVASCDPFDKTKSLIDHAKEQINKEYSLLYKEHLKAYKAAFEMIDIKIEGDDELDTYLRYANYQTLIGFDRYDSVHSLSAKNLTAEKYNQFVWWDAEIFQLPVVISTFPNAAKAALEYRYRALEESKKNAIKDGLKGARYAFCSSVKGDENVWIYARHPFLQIHINGDIGYGVYNYYRQTLDKEFMLEKGLEMMIEVIKFYHSRATRIDGKLHLLNVTGTDEHHPYVNNDAYTDYQAKFVASKALELVDSLGYPISDEDRITLKDFADNLYLLPLHKDKLIPQFKGYFDLKPYLPLAGNGAAKGFQMKASGLYHLSQIIKQPDVLNLYTYLDIGMDEKIYKANYRYYEHICEASSSLTFPVHAMSALDNKDYAKFKENLYNSILIDINDIHNCAYQGVHAACLAGGWMNFYRGVFGIRPRENELYLDPRFVPGLDKVSMNFIYQGSLIHISMDKKKITLTSDDKKEFIISYKGNNIVHKGHTVLNK